MVASRRVQIKKIGNSDLVVMERLVAFRRRDFTVQGKTKHPKCRTQCILIEIESVRGYRGR